MRTKIIIAALLTIVALVWLRMPGGHVSAQVPIAIDTSCSQTKTSYASPQEWPWVDTDVWWAVLDAVNPMGVTMPGHTHIRVAEPECGRLSGGLLTLPLALYQFDQDAVIGPGLDVFNAFGSIVSFTPMTGAAFVAKYGAAVAKWAPSTQSAWPFTGHVNTLEVLDGEVTIDLSTLERGWNLIPICTMPRYRDARAGQNSMVCAFPLLLSEIDGPGSGGYGVSSPRHESHAASFGSPLLAPFNYGAFNVLQLAGPLPIDPIDASHPYTVTLVGYDYANADVVGTTDLIEGANFHAGNPGVTLATSAIGSLENVTVTLTGATPGTPELGRWCTPAGNVALLCTNLGFAAPDESSGSITPPPPPPPTWLPVAGQMQQLGNLVRWCIGSLCTSPIPVQ